MDVSFNAGTSHFSVEMNERVKGGPRRMEGLTLPMPGEYNISNAIAAIVVANSHYVTTTDGRGEFKLGDVPDGEHQLVAVDAAGNRRKWSVRVGAEPVRVKLDF